MIEVATRFNGVRLPHVKPYAGVRLTELPAPDTVWVPLLQHMGVPGEACVKRGDRVRIGDPLSISRQPREVPVHSPVSGVVKGVVEGVLPSGKLGTLVQIENDGQDERRDGIGRPSPDDYTVEEIHERVQQAGIVGLGGAAFPAAIKLAPRTPIDTIILNGCEGEPVLTADHRIMLEETEALLYGARAIQLATGAKRVILAVEAHAKDVVRHVRAQANGVLEVVTVPEKYPVSAEVVLIKAILGRLVRLGEYPGDVGVTVCNVGTTVAIGQALRDGVALTRRAVTVSGGAVERPGNYWVRVGTRVSDVLASVGCREARQVLLGGPMMGQSVPALDIPVVKGTSGVLALTDAEVLANEPSPCMRCGQCIDACAYELTPIRLAQMVADNQLDEAENWGLTRCMECGSCAYVCPSRIPLVQWMRTGKSMLQARRK